MEIKEIKHAGGRPTIYSQEILDKTKWYLENYITLDEIIPTIEGLSLHLNLSRPTIYDWASQEDKAEFSYIVEDILAKQGLKLVNKGLIGDYNPTIAKLMLTKHGYIDKQDLTSDGKAIKGNSIVFSNFKDETTDK